MALPGRLGRVWLGVATLSGSSCHRSVEEEPEPSEHAFEYAEALCEAAATCACSGPLAEPVFCESEHVRWFAALEASLDLNNGCLDTWIAAIELGDCPAAGEDAWMDASECEVFRGTKGLGAACQPHPEVGPLFAEECADGLRCSRGLCVEESETTDLALGEGDACSPLTSPTCGGSFELYCDDGTCRRHTPDGGTCDSAIECESMSYCEGLWSDDSGTCAPMKDVGDTCDPRDQGGCLNYAGLEGATQTSDFEAWCDPAVGSCVEGRIPRVCGALNNHLPRP